MLKVSLNTTTQHLHLLPCLLWVGAKFIEWGVVEANSHMVLEKYHVV